jgi:acyl-coenzyme A synthetase/AMP-(fatty) acid ligase
LPRATSYSTVYLAFVDAAEQHPSNIFLRVPATRTATQRGDAVEYNYQSALERVRELANGYDKAGVQQEQRVAIAFDSRIDVYLHMLALNSLGASVVPLNMAASDTELQYVVDHSDSVLLTGAGEHLDRLAAIAGNQNKAKVVAPTSLLGESQTIRAAGNATTEVALLYTSGTTGKPKGCMLSNDYFLTMGREYNRLGGLCAIDGHDRLLTPLPPNHMNALATSFMAMMMCGGCIIQLDRFHPRDWWKTVREEGATVIHYLGVMPAILLTLAEEDGENVGGQVKFGFGAGSDPRHQQIFEERFGFPLIEAWAMTESGAGGMTVANKEPRHLGTRCIGRAIDTMEYRVVDESDADVAVGSDGEFLVRSRGDDPRAGFFSGYYKDAAATEDGWRGGWWHTGDVVRVDDDGSLYFVDRRKNVIRRSGENIAAVEVEAALLSCNHVSNCAVTAVPDEFRGDEVFAFVVAGKHIDDTERIARDTFEHSMKLLTYFKTPGYIAFVDELPLTASQKVSRADVKALALACVESGKCIDTRSLKKRQPL